MIEGKIPNKNSGDVTLAVKLDGEKYKEVGFPSKEGHKFNGYECTNGVTLTWNKETWKALIETDKPTVCTLEFETKYYEEEILAGSYPVIKDELIPVVISDNGTVKKADTKDEWYSYANSRWANAVILKQTSSKTYNVNDVIEEDDIESYFVWIPKYKYQIWCATGTCNTPQLINIEFGTTNESGSTNGSWLTHPAFTSLRVNGIWVGKFETTGTTEALTVKPNSKSLSGQTVGTFYNLGFNYKRTNDSKTNLDSHMMKNTEWGAVAYLTNSKYGRENSEIWINNDRDNVTGCVGTSASASIVSGCANPYGLFATTDEQRKNNVHGSTTDNISGIYDMNGGFWEYVMGYLDGYPGLSWLDLTSINVKYYDKYTGTDVGSARILGDATDETYRWNADFPYSISTNNPWVVRGGDVSYSTGSGVFSRSSLDGAGHNAAFRLVLSPSN